MAFFRFPCLGDKVQPMLLPTEESSVARWKQLAVRQPSTGASPLVANSPNADARTNEEAGVSKQLSIAEWQNTDFDLDDSINVTRRTSSSLLLLSGASDTGRNAASTKQRQRSLNAFLELSDYFDWSAHYQVFADVLQEDFDDPNNIRLPLLDPDSTQFTRLTKEFQRCAWIRIVAPGCAIVKCCLSVCRYETLFFLFANHLMEYIGETIAGTTFRHRKRLLLHSIQGYQKILKVLLLEMKVLALSDYPPPMINLSRAMLLDASNLGVYLRIVVRKYVSETGCHIIHPFSCCET